MSPRSFSRFAPSLFQRSRERVGMAMPIRPPPPPAAPVSVPVAEPVAAPPPRSAEHAAVPASSSAVPARTAAAFVNRVDIGVFSFVRCPGVNSPGNDHGAGLPCPATEASLRGLFHRETYAVSYTHLTLPTI